MDSWAVTEVGNISSHFLEGVLRILLVLTLLDYFLS